MHTINNLSSSQLRNYSIPKNCMTRAELAMELFPSANSRQAVAKMRYWMLNDKLLQRSLRHVGYRPNKHIVRGAVVKVFREFFG